jgi:carboxyvinyl-carboxyphosphonate phosphorylmutase
MDWSERRERCRALFSGQACVYPGSVFDALSARMAEELGYEVGIFAGSIASLTVLGAPDLTVLTLSEFADQAHRICRAGNLALLVDADHGYGNALNVRRTVDALETAGVSVLSIEDTLLPAAYGGGGQAQLLSLQEGVGKMRAAVDARQDARLMIAGRTSAVSISGIDDAIARGQAYAAAGVDTLFYTGLKTRAQLDAIVSAVKLPLILGAPAAELMDRDYLASRRVRICLQGHAPFMAGVQAVYAALKAMRQGEKPVNVASAELMQRLSRDADYERWSREYLGG